MMSLLLPGRVSVQLVAGEGSAPTRFMRTNCSVPPDGDFDRGWGPVCNARTAPVGSRKRLYPAPRARNFTLGSAWPWLGSKINGNCPRIARALGFACAEDLEEVGIGETGGCAIAFWADRRKADPSTTEPAKINTSTAPRAFPRLLPPPPPR